jgi:Holliday junction resolvase
VVNQKKRKGTAWERELVELLLNIPASSAKRVAGSGAFGTVLTEPSLLGDVVLVLDDLPRKFRIECKTGYGGSSQMTIKREWFEKIAEEAEKSYSIPLIALKFSNVKGKSTLDESTGRVKYVIAMDLAVFIELMTYLVNLKEELDKLYTWKHTGT